MDYVPVRVSTLRGDQKISFDVFIALAGKYVLYVRRGDKLDSLRLDKLKSKRLNKLYIAMSDEPLYREYLELNYALAFSKDSTAKIRTRAEIAHGAQQDQVEEVFEKPHSEAAYLTARDMCRQFSEFLLDNPEALREVLVIPNPTKNLAHHCVTVCSLALGLARELGLKDHKALGELAMGALLHDIGHNQSDLNHAQPLSNLTREELKAYRRHPFTGAEILQDKKHFDERVIHIIMQHHECVDGSGFPNQLQKKNIDPLALIVAVAENYDRLVTFEELSHAEASQKLMIENLGRYPLDHIQSLLRIVKDL